MGIFEIEGSAHREVKCDIAEIKITFAANGKNSHEVSRKVLDQCDAFLDEISKVGMKASDFSLDNDRVHEVRYREDCDICADRSLRIRLPYNMKGINMIQTILQNGKYDYEIDVNGDLSNRAEIRSELLKEALLKSKADAELLAETLGIKVTGIDSVRKDQWDDDEDEHVLYKCYKQECAMDYAPRPSDYLGAKTVEETVNLKVKWILE